MDAVSSAGQQAARGSRPRNVPFACRGSPDRVRYMVDVGARFLVWRHHAAGRWQVPVRMVRRTDRRPARRQTRSENHRRQRQADRSGVEPRRRGNPPLREAHRLIPRGRTVEAAALPRVRCLLAVPGRVATSINPGRVTGGLYGGRHSYPRRFARSMFERVPLSALLRVFPRFRRVCGFGASLSTWSDR